MSKIVTCDGKYTTINDNGKLKVYRNGDMSEPWREKDLVGDKYVLSLVQKIEELESKAVWFDVNDILPDYDVPVLWKTEAGIIFQLDIEHDISSFDEFKKRHETKYSGKIKYWKFD